MDRLNISAGTSYVEEVFAVLEAVDNSQAPDREHTMKVVHMNL